MDARPDSHGPTPSPAAAGEPTVPARLGEALRRAYPDPTADLTRLDDAVLREARSRLGRRPVLARIGLPLAAAAALGLAAVGVWWMSRPSTPAGPALGGLAAAGPTDAGPSANVTILDAFALARKLRDRGPAGPGAAWDVTGDGSIDQRDVDALAHRAVKLASPPSVTRADRFTYIAAAGGGA